MIYIEDRRYYVYALIDPRDLTVFYIGRGHGERASKHFKEARKKGSHSHPRFAKINKIRTCGLEPYYIKLKSNLTFNESCREEESWIYKIGLELLTNIDSGGKLGGDVFTNHPNKEAYRKKISKASKRSNSKNRHVHRKNTLELWKNPDYIEKQREAGLKNSKRWKDENFRSHIISKLKQVDPKLRAKAAKVSNERQKEIRTNSKWMTKDGKNKLVLKSDTHSYLDVGWTFGLSKNAQAGSNS